MLITVQKYDFTPVYKRGKELIIADALSRAYLNSENNETNELDQNIAAHVNLIKSELGASDYLLEEIRRETAADPELLELSNTIQNGWPNSNNKLTDKVKIYCRNKSELSVINGVVFKGKCIVIPRSLRKETLNNLHYNHMGLSKSLQLAENKVFWPTLRNELKQLVENCSICLKFARSQKSEPLQPHDIPKIPWYKVGCDLFELKGVKYLLAVDYYSKFVEVKKLTSNTTSQTIILKLKEMFARFGIPKIVITDGGPQFSSDLFEAFAKSWNFEHITSTPLYPQSNGMAERHIQTVKHMLTKVLEDNKEIELALLQLRNTPIIDGLSPAQLLMGKNIRSHIPTVENHLIPTPVNYHKYNKYLNNYRQKTCNYYNKKQGATPLNRLRPETPVLVQKRPNENLWSEGVIKKSFGNRRYAIRMASGAILIRNRKFIKPK